MNQVKRLESEGPQGGKYSLDEKDKMIQILNKRLKISPIDHSQTIELIALEQEKEAFRQEALKYKSKVLQLEKGERKLVTSIGNNIICGYHCTY
jgi:hypothetical protein